MTTPEKIKAEFLGGRIDTQDAAEQLQAIGVPEGTALERADRWHAQLIKQEGETALELVKLNLIEGDLDENDTIPALEKIGYSRDQSAAILNQWLAEFKNEDDTAALLDFLGSRNLPIDRAIAILNSARKS